MQWFVFIAGALGLYIGWQFGYYHAAAKYEKAMRRGKVIDSGWWR